MKRLILGVVFAFGVGAGVTAATIVRLDFLHAIDRETLASPCGASPTVQATPFVFEGVIWTTYLCADNRVVMREFNVWTATGIPPAPVVCPGIFVHTADKQGCVPPDHPLAPKGTR